MDHKVHQVNFRELIGIEPHKNSGSLARVHCNCLTSTANWNIFRFIEVGINFQINSLSFSQPANTTGQTDRVLCGN